MQHLYLKMIESVFRLLVFIWDTPSSIEVKHVFIYMSESWEGMRPCSDLWTSKNTFMVFLMLNLRKYIFWCVFLKGFLFVGFYFLSHPRWRKKWRTGFHVFKPCLSTAPLQVHCANPTAHNCSECFHVTSWTVCPRGGDYDNYWLFSE